MPTIAEQLIEEGRQEAIANYLVRQLQHKFKFVPEYYKKQVEQASHEHLLTWGNKILDSAVLEEVFEGLERREDMALSTLAKQLDIPGRNTVKHEEVWG